MKKDTIYIDIEDEITSITDKVQTSKEDIIALVLPKRCQVLQSSVNIKILKKTSDEAGKKIVLITSEHGVLPIAGAAGIFVAKTLQSKPYLPASPDTENENEIEEADAPETPVDTNKSLEELAGATAVSAAVNADEDAPIEIGDDASEEEAKKPGKKDKKPKKDSKLKVPNFDKFRTRLFIGIGAGILLVVLLIVALVVLPKATVAIRTENKSVPVDITVVADPSATEVDAENNVVPATVKNMDKTESKQFNATGQKNKGEKATGRVRFSVPCNAVGGSPVTVAAGTGVSTGGLTFITQEEATLTSPSFSGGCKFLSDDVNVTAQNPGDQYNLSSGRTFSVAGYSSVSGSNSKGMSGGTNNIVKVVSESDCENAKNEILNAKTDDYKNQLSGQLTALGLTPVPETFTAAPGAVTCNPNVDEEASSGTANVTFKTSMLGVNTEALEQLAKNAATKDLQGSQTISDSGVKTATMTVTNRNNNGQITFQLKTDAQAGVKPDTANVAKAIAGKKKGDSITYIKALPGVTDVKISYSPFWVYKTPSNTKKITVKFVNNDSK